MELQALSKELGYPSAAKLYKAARRQGLDVKLKDVEAIVKTQATRQVLHKKPAFVGKIAATEINDRWAADLIDYTAKPSVAKIATPVATKEPPYQYIFIVQDIFSRKVFAEPLRTKTPQACKEAMERVVAEHGKPLRLDTDDGPEFKTTFQAYLDQEHIFHVTGDPRSKNDRATLDHAIKSVRQQLARIQVAEGTRDWAPLVSRVVNAYNDTVHDALEGRAPDDVEGDADLQFSLEQKAARDLQTNTKLIEARGQKLLREGGFRTELPPNDFERSFHPRYSDVVHKVKAIHNAYVEDEHGNIQPTKHVLAVPSASENVDTKGLGLGSAQREREHLAALEPFKDRILTYVGAGKWIHEVALYMKTIGADRALKGINYKKAALLLGLHVGAKNWITNPSYVAPAGPLPAAPAAPAAAFDAAPRPVLAPVEARRRLNVKTRS
jgi:hypothetical protein